MNILVTIHDEETNMASTITQLDNGRLSVGLFDIDAERYVFGHTVTYPASMMENAVRKAFEVSVPAPIITDGLREEWSATKDWIAEMDAKLGFT